MVTHKVSIAISGAASLGSYEAGTVYEIVHAIKLHNKNNPDNRIVIDVVSGASAGGITAALLTQKLLFDADALEDPVDNCLYQTWVKNTDINALIDTTLGDDPTQSLLSSNKLKKNAEDILLPRYQQAVKTASPHLAAGDTVQLGLALSNLNGVDYELPTFASGETGLTQGEFIQTRNQDRYTTEVDSDCDNAAFWEEIIQAGCASGAFPIAFKSVQLQRNWHTLDYKGLGAKNWEDVFDGNFSYADGGIFNNYPLGMARDLSFRQDELSDDVDKRFYFYISPVDKTSSADYTFMASNANILDSLGQIVKSILSNSRFQDWVNIDNMNSELSVLHRQASAFLDLLKKADAQELASIKLATKQFCQFLYSADDHRYQKDIAHADKNFSYLLSESTTLNHEEKNIWLNIILIMQMNTKLGGQNKMTIYTISADITELASAPISAFFGFLDIRFRQHDYLVGRLKARKMINQIIAVVKEGAVNQLPLTIEPLSTVEIEDELKHFAGLSDADMTDVALATRKQLYKRLKDRSYSVMKILKINKVVSHLVFFLAVRGKLQQFLHL